MSFETTGLSKITDKLQNGPCLVAQLGALLLPEEKPSVKFREALEAAGIQTQFGRDRTELYAFLPGQEEILADIRLRGYGDSALPKYRLAVRVAFSKILRPDEAMYLITFPKIRYDVIPVGNNPAAHAVLVDSEYRMPGIDLVHHEKSEELQRFAANLDAWCKKYNISKELMLWTPSPLPKQEMKTDIAKILRDFIEAQPADIRARVNIPGAIIQMLLSHE